MTDALQPYLLGYAIRRHLITARVVDRLPDEALAEERTQRALRELQRTKVNR